MSLSENTPLLPTRKPGSGVINQVRAVATACLGALSFGLVLGYSSSALPQLQKNGYLSESEAAWYGSLVTLAAMVGGLFGGYLVDYVGRRTSLMINAIPYTVGWLINICTTEVFLLYIGRLFTGLGVGISSISVPIYIAEVSSPEYRGRFVSCFQVCITLGILTSYVLGLWVDFIWLSIISSVIPAMMAVLLPFVPETPSWLLRQRRRSEALSALLWLRNAETEREISNEWIELDGSLDTGNGNEPFKLRDFRNPGIYKPFLMSLFLMFAQQFSGINAVVFYTNSIFSGAGFKGNSGIPTVIIGALMAAFTVVMVMVVDKLGRRVLLISSGIVLTLSSALFGLYYYMDSQSLGWLSLASLALYISSFSMGWGALPWVVTAELLPQKGYGLTSGICTAFNWTLAFIVTKEFSAMTEALTNYGTFWIFGGVCLFGAVGTAFWIPETKGKSLKEIALSFQ